MIALVVVLLLPIMWNISPFWLSHLSQSSAALAAVSRLASEPVLTLEVSVGWSCWFLSPHDRAIGSKVGLDTSSWRNCSPDEWAHTWLCFIWSSFGKQIFCDLFPNTSALMKAFCCCHQRSFKICRMRNKLIIEKQRLLDEGFSFLVQARVFTSTKHLQAFLEWLTQIVVIGLAIQPWTLDLKQNPEEKPSPVLRLPSFRPSPDSQPRWGGTSSSSPGWPESSVTYSRAEWTSKLFC